MLPAFHTPSVFSDKEFEVTRLSLALEDYIWIIKLKLWLICMG